MEHEALFDDEAPLHTLEPHFAFAEIGPHWSEKFRYNIYNWKDPAYQKLMRKKNGYRPIKMSDGHFFFVTNKDYKRMSQYPEGDEKKWCPKIDLNPDGSVFKIYARRRGRGVEPHTVYAHREILRCLHLPGDGDHVNNWGLDNRCCEDPKASNLDYVPKDANNSNSVRYSKYGLLPGVELRASGRDGLPRYGGKRCKRKRNGKVRTFRSGRVWRTQEPANRWFRNFISRLYDRRAWAHYRPSITFPVFPPLRAEYRRQLNMIERAIDTIGATF